MGEKLSLIDKQGEYYGEIDRDSLYNSKIYWGIGKATLKLYIKALSLAELSQAETWLFFKMCNHIDSTNRLCTDRGEVRLSLREWYAETSLGVNWSWNTARKHLKVLEVKGIIGIFNKVAYLSPLFVLRASAKGVPKILFDVFPEMNHTLSNYQLKNKHRFVDKKNYESDLEIHKDFYLEF